MPKAELTFEAIGAPWQIETPDALPDSLVAAIHTRIDEYDATYSRFRDGSLVSRIAGGPGTWQFPSDAAPLFALYRRLYDATGGTLTPLVGRRLELLGYDRDYTLRPADELGDRTADGADTGSGHAANSNSNSAGSRVVIPRWEDVMHWDETGATLTTSEPVVIDVGAAGKGYLVDIIAGMLRDAGIDEYVVDASGDLVHRGDEPVRVGLEHPFDPSLAIGVYELSNGALCASAPGRRAWGTALHPGLHHILDGISGEPTTKVAATWAAASTGLVADGLATALFFTPGAELAAAFEAGPSSLATETRFQYVRMFPNSAVEHSPDFRGELFT
jgi:thiamine biosynthesis lipoprotein